MSSWYRIIISKQSTNTPIFDGYFRVNNNLITEIYDLALPSNGFYTNVILPVDDEAAFGSQDTASNVYPLDSAGVNFYSEVLKNFFNISQNHFNIYGKDIGVIPIVLVPQLYTSATEELNTPAYTTSIVSIADPSCFNEGTKILCLNKNLEEEYIPIENLRKGDLVKSYKYGYRKIDLIGKNPMINNPEKFNECMYKMEKTDNNGLLEDLIVTGGHSILVDSLGEYKEENDKIFGGIQIMIDDKYLLLSAVSKDFKKLENNNLYTYYHFILENNGSETERFGVWANGLLTETTFKKDFMNHSYTLL
jgi:hypothetical protein